MSESSPEPIPLVAVGLPVYNSERHLEQALDSLLAQTFRDFEILISDNASTDATGDICRRYAERDPRIRYHRNPTNVGLAANFNLVFSRVRSKYFRWATGDDYCDPEMLQDAVDVLESDPSIVLCYPRAWFVDHGDKKLGEWEDTLHLMQDDPMSRYRAVHEGIYRVHHHLGLMRADCVRRTALFERHVASDVGMVAELALLGKFCQIPKRQFYRRLHEDSSSWSHEEKQQARRYHAANVNRVPWNRLRYHWRFVRGVARSSLRLGQKLELFRFLLQRAIADRRRLIVEARHEGRLLLDRFS